MTRRRILVLCTDLGVRVPGPKGASLHLQAVTRGFAALGHDVLLVAVAGHGNPELSVPSGGVGSTGAGRIIPLLLPHPGRAEGLERERRKLAFVEALDRRVGATVRAFGPDLLYERFSLFGNAGVALAGALGVPHVVEVNALLAEEEQRWRSLVSTGLAAEVERQVLTAATLRVAVSDEVATSVARVTGRDDLLTLVVPNGVDVAQFGALPDRVSARRAFDLDPTGPVAVFVGTLRPWHGLENAIDALPRLPGLVLVVAGDGPVRDELAVRAAALGVADRVRWLAHVAHGSIPNVLAAADVVVAPYPAGEGFAFSPLKVLEYLASGVPVVASDIGQLPALLDSGRFGRLVPAGDVTAFADAVADVLADPAAARRAAALARAHTLQHHGWEGRVASVLRGVDAVAGVGEVRHALAG